MMKKLFRYISFALIPMVWFTACEDALEVTPPGELAPENALNVKKGITALLYSAYGHYSYTPNPNQWNNVINMMETCTDVAYNTGGAENRRLSLFINFQWDASERWLDGILWRRPYLAIRDANLVIEHVDNVQDLTDVEKAQYKAEARYIRAAMYSMLYNWFGPVPLHISPEQDAHQPRATKEEMETFIATELAQVVENLPAPGQEAEYGRATKGHALAFLTKFYLNTKQWQNTVDASQDLMDLGYYGLVTDLPYKEIFQVENEGNNELIVVWQRVAETGFGNTYANGVFPPNFKVASHLPEYTWTDEMNNWGTQYRLRDDFVDSFDPADERFELVIEEYTNKKGETVNLRTAANNARYLKYFDNNAILNFHGNDYVVIRYADILLSRAEALNELNGPTTEALGLVNQIRNRAGLGDVTAASKDELRGIILEERAKEFISEGKRREDLIRHGKFISSAQARGINAEPHHVLFPIPQPEINANDEIGPEHQNEGY